MNQVMKTVFLRVSARDLGSVADSCVLRSTKSEPGFNTSQESLDDNLMCGLAVE